MSSVLIAGSTGLVGGHLLLALLANDTYDKIISIGRRKVEIQHPKLEQHIVDFNELEKISIEADIVFCCLGTTINKAGSKEEFRKVDFDFPKLLASYSLKSGAKAFHLISSMGANENSSIFYNKTKGEIENKIMNMSFNQLHMYRPSMLSGKRSEKRILEAIGLTVFKALRFLFIGPLKNYKVIEAEKVANFMVESSLIKKDGTFMHLSGNMQ